ncbi:ATP-dependent nuclease [Streptosporangium sp. V21-05]|uniref:ATP-dependent nuclease n=1 Tax=Streptosporangium sp. V21-05 TaxID=3446115 RepID=UPI003F52E8D3
MRLSTVKVRDFRSIRYAQLDGLDAPNYVVLAGANGSGKSSMLEAIELLSAIISPPRLPKSALVRLGQERAELSMTFTVTDREFEQADLFHRSIHGRPLPRQELDHRTAVIDTAGQVIYSGSPLAETLFAPAFRSAHGFPRVISMSGNRIRKPDSDALHGASSFAGLDSLTEALMMLDYRSLSSQRAGSSANDYENLARVFLNVTEKRLLLPRFTEGFTSGCIEVELKDGYRHDLSGLSSGELGLLGLLCTLYEAANGEALLLLDEPELHLHATLQAAFLRALRQVASRTQIILVTHSLKIVASSLPSQIYEIRTGDSQVSRVTDPSSMLDVIRHFGVEQADLVLKSGRLVVEGDHDQKRLNQLFPEEIERLHVGVAGDRQRVLVHYRFLEDGPGDLPWLCLIDRDLMSSADLARYTETHPHLHIWPRRSFESMLLEPVLLAAVLQSLGRPASIDEAEALLRAAADGLLSDVINALVQAELGRQFPMPKIDRGRGDKGLEEAYAEQARVLAAKSKSVSEVRRQQEQAVRACWETERFALVDAKKTLGRLAKQLSLFRRVDDLTTALISRAADDPLVRPEGLEQFRQRLTECRRTSLRSSKEMRGLPN